MDNLFKCDVSVTIDSAISIDGFTLDSRYTKTQVQYQMDVEYKSWGINGISVSMPNQTVTVKLELTDNETEATETYSAEIELEDVVVDGELTGHNNLNQCIIPTDLELTIVSIVKKDLDVKCKAKGKLKFS
jgi:hypothetical protein